MKNISNQNQQASLEFSTILASSVHDMKNSVGMLLSSVESILEEYQPARGPESKHFQKLHYEASRINGELIQLLTLYRKDNGFLPLHIDEQYVIDILEEQVARNQVLIDTSGVNITVACDEDLAWYFDADLIGGVIHNVIVNCIRYTKDAVMISASIESEFLVIKVLDNGTGYPDDMLASPAKRVEQAQVARGSTHLGLYFAEEIARLHKQDDVCGRIELRNGGLLGGGEFILSLP